MKEQKATYVFTFLIGTLQTTKTYCKLSQPSTSGQLNTLISGHAKCAQTYPHNENPSMRIPGNPANFDEHFYKTDMNYSGLII